MNGKFYLTTPIYYVNDEPHLGHAYTTVIADILARYHRLFGDRVFFLTGTDERGQKVAEAAAQAGRTPQEHCDLMVQRFQALWDNLEISHDDFIRTTEERHTSRVREVLSRLREAGEIYESTYEGWYCIPDERFWTEKDLVEGNCPLCGREVRRLAEKNYFFRMGQYQPWLIDYIKSHPRFILPESRRNEVLGFLSQPLGDLCISRPKERLSWGIPIPFDEDYVTYVWFDALLNYVTAPQSRGGDWWSADLHLIGKDIITTHSVYWPCMLKAAKLELPQTIFGHGWWLMEDTKMSKSLGNVVKPLALVDKYGVDAFRFFLAREMSLGMDASFSESALVNRYNSELANDLGNLASRLLKLLATFSDGRIPPPVGDAYPEHDLLRARLTVAVNDLRLNAGLDDVMSFVRSINKAVEDAAPWKTGKTDPEGTRRFLRRALEDLALAALLLEPVMPGKMAELLSMIGVQRYSGDWTRVAQHLEAGKPLPARAALFPRIQQQATESPIPPAETPLTLDEFRRLDLRVAKIVKAEVLKGSNKLLVLQVDLGGDIRQVVAGIAQHYRPEDLVGKSVVLLANLQPARLRGVESQGMLLAAQSGDRLVLIAPESDIDSGAKIS